MRKWKVTCLQTISRIHIIETGDDIETPEQVAKLLGNGEFELDDDNQIGDYRVDSDDLMIEPTDAADDEAVLFPGYRPG